MKIVKIKKFSSKRTTLFNKIKSQLFPESHNLKPLCQTWRTVPTTAISTVLENHVWGFDFHHDGESALAL